MQCIQVLWKVAYPGLTCYSIPSKVTPHLLERRQKNASKTASWTLCLTRDECRQIARSYTLWNPFLRPLVLGQVYRSLLLWFKGFFSCFFCSSSRRYPNLFTVANRNTFWARSTGVSSGKRARLRRMVALNLIQTFFYAASPSSVLRLHKPHKRGTATARNDSRVNRYGVGERRGEE